MILTETKYVIYGVALGDFLKNCSSLIGNYEFDTHDIDYGIELILNFPTPTDKEDFENGLKVLGLPFKIGE